MRLKGTFHIKMLNIRELVIFFNGIVDFLPAGRQVVNPPKRSAYQPAAEAIMSCQKTFDALKIDTLAKKCYSYLKSIQYWQ